MKLFLIHLVCVAVLLYTVSAKPATADDDYDPSIISDDPALIDEYDTDDVEDDEDEKELEAPDIFTESKTIYAKAGDDVSFDCNATNADIFTTMWKRNNDIIFQDTHLLLSKPANKFHRFDNRTIIIRDFQETDVGDYVCIILSQLKKEPSVTHHAKLTSSPKITSLETTSGRNEFNVGDEFTLKCEAYGGPPPKITWSLKGKRFDISGHELTISDAKHSDGGLYQCLADNQIGLPSHLTINIQIYQKPVVQLDRFTTTGDNGTFNVELVCKVHSVPESSDVQWRLNDNILNSNAHHKIRNKNDKHTITIFDAKDDDFGDYTCIATNTVGSSSRSIHVSNKPGKPIFIHGDHKHGHKSVTLVWKMESMSPVNKFELKYRNTQVDDWVVINPELIEGDGNMYNLKYTLEHLADGEYEAMSRAKNSYGWGEYSDPKPFNATRQHEHIPHHKTEHADHDQETVLNSDEALKSTSRDSGSALVPSIVLLLATILTIFSVRH